MILYKDILKKNLTCLTSVFSFVWISFFTKSKEFSPYYHQTGDICTLGGSSLKLVHKFTYLGSSVSSTEKDNAKRLTKAWTAIDKLSVIEKSDVTDKMKRSFFQAAVVSILTYGCTTWMLTKRMENKLEVNYTRILRSIPGGNTPQSTSCTATYIPSRKLSQVDKPGMWDTTGEAGASS